MHRAAVAAVAIAAVAVLVLPACIVPLAIPSTRVEGGYTPGGDGNLRVGTHLAGYRHVRQPRWDLGAGYSRSASTFDAMIPAANGFYLEGAYLHPLGDNARVSIGPGLDLRFRDEADLVPVAYVRAGVEMFAPIKAHVSSDDKCGVTTGTWYGQLGLGAYVDVQTPIGERGVAAVIGLSGRIPSFAGVGIYIPYCK